ncbi:MAG: hypothetical protein PHI58_06675 [Candidatus Omnitrophica bacterium]|nr:hypothetical protein [Candidatus Omnitrophota bacterium]
MKKDTPFPKPSAKLYDRLRLAVSLIIVSPLAILAILAITIGYPLHLVKKYAMKKIAIALVIFLFAAQSAYAINIVEKLLYKEDAIKIYNAKVLVVPFTGEVKYIWCGNPENGYWMPVAGKVKQQYQALYDKQNNPY